MNIVPLRTPEQINNLRKTFTPILRFADDITVDNFATHIQRKLWLEDPRDYEWTVETTIITENGEEVMPQHTTVPVSFAILLSRLTSIMNGISGAYIEKIRVSRPDEDGRELYDTLTHLNI